MVSMPFMYIKFVMTLPSAFTFCGGFQHYYFNFRFRNGEKKKKKKVPKLERADKKKLLEESCVRNFRNPLFCKTATVRDFRTFPEIILGKNIRCSKFWSVRNFRTFTVPHFSISCVLQQTESLRDSGVSLTVYTA